MDSSAMHFTPAIVMRQQWSDEWTPTVVLHRHGEMDNIKIEMTPSPIKLEDDHIEIIAFFHGLNFTDHYLRLGIIKNRDFPIIMGSECTGIVSRIGGDVTDLKEGDRVLCLRMHAGMFQRCLQVPRRYCYLLADHVSLRNGVAFGLSFVVAHTCLFELGRLRPGQIVFMTGIAGGVGTSVVQLARSVRNVKVVGTASEAKHGKLRSLGVDHVFRHGESARLLIAYPRGADIVINSNGGSDIEECLALLKPFGRLINIGSNNSVRSQSYIPSPLPQPKWDNKNIRSGNVITKNSIISGLDIGHYLENNRRKVHAMLNNAYFLALRQEVRPIIHRVLPFEEASEGLNILCRRENFGKVILHIR